MMRFRFRIWLLAIITTILSVAFSGHAKADDIIDADADVVGDFQWVASQGGALQDSSNSVAVGPGGSIVVVGSFQGSADFDPGPGSRVLTSRGYEDGYIVKLGSNGDLIWAVSVGGPGQTIANDVFIDSYGDIYVVGQFSEWADFDPSPVEYRLTSNGSSDVFLLRLDPFGNLVWVGAIGGGESDTGEAVFIDGRRNIYITGSFEKNMNANLDPNGEPYWLSSKGEDDIFVVRYANNGAILRGWSMGGDDDSVGRDLLVDGAGNVYIAGDFEGKVDFAPGEDYTVKSLGHEDIFLTKYNDAGYMVWTLIAGGPKHDTKPSISMDIFDNIYMTGSFESEIGFDPGDGQLRLVSRGEEDIFMAKINPFGGVVWANSVGGVGTDRSIAITTGQRGDFFVTGTYESVVDFDPGPATTALGALAGKDAFIARYWQSGFLASVQSMSGPLEEQGRSVVMDQDGAVYVAGNYESIVDFNVGGDKRVKQSAGGVDGFVSKWRVLLPAGDEMVHLPMMRAR